MNKSNMSNISEASTTEAPAVSRTDWDRIDAMSDEDIDISDMPPLTEEELARSWWRFPAPPRSVVTELTVDEDILVWFQSLGQDYPQRMRAALRLYAEAHQASR